MRKMITIRLVLLSLLLSIIIAGVSSSSIACENFRLNIGCTSGYYLDIVSALYGRKYANICYKKGLVSNTNCSAQTALAVMKSRCNILSECTVDAANHIFGDPCYSTFKYLEVEYRCLPIPAVSRDSHDFSIACETDKMNIACDTGYKLKIVSALYGRKDENICYKKGLVSNTNCAAQTALAVMQSRCDNLTKCTVDASDTIFGNPCNGTYKYLEVQYKCLPNTFDNYFSIECENDTLWIGCTTGAYLRFEKVLYGRKSRSICPKEGHMFSDDCEAKTALNVLQSRCNNLQNCKVNASNTVFGDPCVGTYKYLEVEYRCIRKE